MACIWTRIRRNMRRLFPGGVLSAAVLVSVSAGLSACVEVAVGTGATVGLAAHQERGLDGVTRDTKLATQIRMNYLESSAALATNVGIEVYEGRALLTGLVDSEAQRAAAVKMAWAVIGIKDVINEIQLRSEEGVVEFAHDSWITTQLQATITFDEDIYAVNYSIETVNAVVYLIGIAQDQAELERVLAHARGIERVRRVVTYVRIKETAT